MKSEELLSRSLKLLQGAIRASGMTQTELDERIGRRRGYLSHVFQRRVDLKVLDLLSALDELAITPSRFFETVAEGAQPGSSGVLRLLADRLAREPRPASPPLPAAGLEAAENAELEERVRGALRSILSQLGRESRAYGS